MSGLLVGRCYGLRLRQAHRDLLIALADHADDFGNNVRPSVAYLVWKLDCNRSTVQRNLRGLQAIGESAPGSNDGLLQLVHEGTPTMPREYRIAIDRGPRKPRYEPARRGPDVAAERGPQSAAPQNAAGPPPTQEGGRTATQPKPPEEPGGGGAPARDDQPVEDFPKHLLPHLREAFKVLRDLARSHGAAEVNVRSLSSVVMARQSKPIVKAAYDFRSWADGRATRRKDVVAGYRNWLDKCDDIAGGEPPPGTPGAPPSGGGRPRGGALRRLAEMQAGGA